MSDIITAGATSQSIYFTIDDSNGSKKTGLVAASFTARYTRHQGLSTSISLSNLAAADSSYSSGGIKEVDSTNQKGLYRLDVPNAGIAAGARVVIVSLIPASGVDARQVDKEILLTALDFQAAFTLSSAERNAIADAYLDRDLSTGTDSGSTTVRTVRQALRWLRNKWAISGTTLTVYKEDDTTASWAATIVTNSSQSAVQSSDPAGP